MRTSLELNLENFVGILMMLASSTETNTDRTQQVTKSSHDLCKV